MPHHEDDDLAVDTTTFIKERNATNVVIPSERNGEGDCAVCGQRENHLEDCATLLRRHGKSRPPVMRSDADVIIPRLVAVNIADAGDVKEIVQATHCEQCDVDCFACHIGEPHMNTEPPFEGYTSERTSEVDWPAHNGKGHHHVVWNGAHNEILPCGSDRCNALSVAIMEERAAHDKIDDRPNANRRQVAGSHYGLGARQHWDLVVEFDLDYFQGQITKYVMRWDKKNGMIDLEKAAHFLEKYIEEIRAGRILKGSSRTTLPVA